MRLSFHFKGYQIGERIKSFKPSRLLYHDAVKNPHADSIYEFVDLDTLLAESDILICMCSLTKETEGLFNMKLFKKMKPTAIFINCSRGVVVNQEDLCQALKTNIIAAAGNLFYFFFVIKRNRKVIRCILFANRIRCDNARAFVKRQ